MDQSGTAIVRYYVHPRIDAAQLIPGTYSVGVMDVSDFH
jgi:hypothetical protein